MLNINRFIMKSLCILLLIGSIISSCNEYGKNENPYHKSNSTLKYQLKDSCDVVFPLDSITSHILTALDYNDDLGLLSFISDRRILMYDYDKKILINAVDIQCSSPSSYTIINKDSLVVIDYNSKSMIICDTSGKQLNSFRLLPQIKYSPLPINKISPIVSRNGYITFIGNMAGEYSDENESNRKIMGALNLQTKDISYYMPYSDIYKENWGGGLCRWVYSDYNEKLNLYVVSFPVDHSIYTFSWDKNEIKEYYAGSNLIDATCYLNQPKIKPIDSEMKIRHFVENHTYSRILYDKYRNVYYRIAEIKSVFKGVPGWQKEISIIILNDKFEKIGETFIGSTNLNSRYAIFVNDKGLHIPQKSNEDVLKFKIFILCTK